MDPHTNLLHAALAAAERGWHVFPLKPGAKQPALHAARYCPGTEACRDAHQTWEQRATTDPDRIRATWTHGPAYNIGLATGPSGLVVIDLDVPKPGEEIPPAWREAGVANGEDALAYVARQAGQPCPGETLCVRTPSGGLHLYYTAPEGTVLRKTEGERGRGLGWKIDTRAWGAYVVAPGSMLDGSAYRALSDAAPEPLPGWLADWLAPGELPAAPVTPIRPARRSRYLEAAIRAESAKVHHAPVGQRNATLYAAAVALGQLVAGGALTEDEHEDALLVAAGRHLAVGAYSEHQARQTIRSGLRDGAKRPRKVA